MKLQWRKALETRYWTSPPSARSESGDWCKRKTAKQSSNKKWQNCRFELNHWMHNGLPLCFPFNVDSEIAGPEGAKNPAGRNVLRLFRSV